jgi:molybdenum cofactor cytidylyltransferase
MVGAIILAAGQGARFGVEPKLLAILDGRPLVRHVAEAALASRARPVIAVLGHRAEDVRAAFSGLDIITVKNPSYRDGLSTSLKTGFAALPYEAQAALVMLGDMPRVGANVVDRLIETWSAGRRPGAVIPTFRGRRGNPVLLSRALAPDIAALAGGTGAGALLRRRADVLEVALDDVAIVQDVDTVEAFRNLQACGRPGMPDWPARDA